MIVALAERVRQLTTRRGELERAHTEAERIAATDQALRQLTPKMARLLATYELVQYRLTDEDRQAMLQHLLEISRQVSRSHISFAAQRQQSMALDKITAAVEDARSVLLAAWTTSSQSLVGPLVEVLAPLEHLPELQAAAAALQQLKRRLEDRTQRTPASPQELADFDADVHRLRSYLTKVEGLNEDVAAFLHSVVAGTATLADLTDAVVVWCRQGDHARVFKVSF